MLKFKIKGSYGETNFGDDLLMLVFENFLLKNFPNHAFDFEGDQADYPSKMLKQSTYNKSAETPDYFIYGGGTQFFSFTSKELSFFDKLGIVLKNPKIILNKLLKKKGQEDTKKFFLGFGLGPFYDNQKVIAYAQSALSQAHFVGLRDETSKRYCEEWGISSFLGADVAFSSYMDLPDLPVNVERVDTKKKIGVIVRDWDWENSGAGFIDHLLSIDQSDKEHNYQFIVFAPEKDKKWLKRLGDRDVLIWNPEKDSISSFLGILNAFDAFISARYHGSIIAALLGKPVICVEIEPKLQILTTQVPEMLLWEKPFSPDDLKGLIQKLNFVDLDYRSSLDNLRHRADAMLKLVVDDIKKN